MYGGTQSGMVAESSSSKGRGKGGGHWAGQLQNMSTQEDWAFCATLASPYCL